MLNYILYDFILIWLYWKAHYNGTRSLQLPEVLDLPINVPKTIIITIHHHYHVILVQ